MKYVIGIDIGTSAVKAILIDEDGRMAAQASQPYPLYQPDNGWAEQDPADWASESITAIQKVMAQSGVEGKLVTGIGLSGQMHGLVMLDEDGRPLRRSIIWCDQRSVREAEELKRRMPADRWLEITANPPIAAWTAAKLLWVRTHEPDIYRRCKHILLPKDYVRYALTGVFATDVSDASGMQLLDVRNRCWSEEVLDKLDISKDMLCRVYESQEVTGVLLPKVARACGLGTEVKVVAGAADNAAAAIGTGVVRQGEAFTSIGTSALVYTHLDHYEQIPEGSLHVCCSGIPGGWFTMGGPQAAGLSLEWFKDNFCREWIEKACERGISVYEAINEGVMAVPPGSGRLIFMPYLMGERTPHMDPKCRGAFVGLNTIHTKAHLLRAIMEGITYSLADCNDILKNLGNPVRRMKVCGGGSKSREWRQMMADLYECDIAALKQEEGPALGAAILAGVGTGMFGNIQDTCSKLVQTGEVIGPDPENVRIYKQYHKLYGRLYIHMKQDFSDLYDIK